MKKIARYAVALSVFFYVLSCADLDINPLSEGSSENWYSDDSEITMSINALYNIYDWFLDPDENTDDYYTRTDLSVFLAGTVNSQWYEASTLWTSCYKIIFRANTILSKIENGEVEISETKLKKYIAEARCVRAAQYARLITHFGDVVFYTKPLNIEEAFALSRTDKNIVLASIYEDFDYAIENLPTDYSSGDPQRLTKGAAMALKARVALYMEDWSKARDAAKQCIDLNQYSLHPDFGELFLSKTKGSVETIWGFPRSVELGILLSNDSNVGIPNRVKTRNPGGTCYYTPTWDLLCAFECVDGLPIDESSLYDPRNPFKNRDPRCTATIVEFQTPHLGFIYQPHPDSTMVLNLTTEKYQTNNDTRSITQWASFNALVWKKGVDDDWIDNKTDPDFIYIRYADVLLMYAEAKIELGDIDGSVLNAINQVRARAYRVDVSQTTEYPAITSMDPNYLRKKVRLERRVEFAYEGLRFMDLIRWRLAEKALTNKNYGMLDVTDLREKVIAPGLWFFPGTPKIDEDGIPDFSEMEALGLIKMLSQRRFDKNKNYLWPIPSKEILINDNLKQNPGY